MTRFAKSRCEDFALEKLQNVAKDTPSVRFELTTLESLIYNSSTLLPTEPTGNYWFQIAT